MSARSKVFIASSSEGIDVATAVRRLLLSELDQIAEIESWTRAFELSATYIESLEEIADKSDFAVMVLTPDDVTTSRKKQKKAPRDNVIFELGLFMGRLGRDRCYLVQEDRPDLKLPSDLLGLKAATFKRPESGDLKAALDAKVALIAERISQLGVRNKLGPATDAAQRSLRIFCERLKGAWWERITIGDKHWDPYCALEKPRSSRFQGREENPVSLARLVSREFLCRPARPIPWLWRNGV
jgi:Predicted nucleotide-binding protein containing TIR-like domain